MVAPVTLPRVVLAAAALLGLLLTYCEVPTFAGGGAGAASGSAGADLAGSGGEAGRLGAPDRLGRTRDDTAALLAVLARAAPRTVELVLREAPRQVAALGLPTERALPAHREVRAEPERPRVRAVQVERGERVGQAEPADPGLPVVRAALRSAGMGLGRPTRFVMTAT